MTHLIRCQACSRHVYAHEAECPFCRQALAPMAAPVGSAESLAPARAANGLSRAQRFAMAAALLGPLAACADRPDEPPSAEPDAGQPPGTGAAAASGGGAAGSAGNPPIIVPLYGAPLAGNRGLPVGDAGPPEGDGGVRDGGPIFHPLYGAPLPQE